MSWGGRGCSKPGPAAAPQTCRVESPNRGSVCNRSAYNSLKFAEAQHFYAEFGEPFIIERRVDAAENRPPRQLVRGHVLLRSLW